MKIIYTVNLGNYDRPIPINPDFLGDWTPVYLSDQKGLEVQGWTTKFLKPHKSLPPVAISRDPKLRPHKYFPKALETLYIDATREVAQPLQNFETSLLGPLQAPVEWCSKHHTKRDCIYQELEAPRVKRLVPDATRQFLRTFYKSENFPEHYGLPENPIIYRKNTYKVQLVGELWWAMMHLQAAWRDQIFLPYVMWKLGLKPSLVQDAELAQFVRKRHKHLPRA